MGFNYRLGFLCVLGVLAVQAIDSPAFAKIPYKHYYRLSLQGQAMGWASEEVQRRADGTLSYVSQITLKFSRLGEAGEAKMRAEVHGDAQGRPLRYSYQMDLGEQTMEFQGEKTKKGFRVIRRAGASKEEKTIQLDPNVQSSVLAMVLFLDGDLRPGKTLDLPVLSEEMGMMTKLKLKLVKNDGDPKEEEKTFRLDLEIMGQRGYQIIRQDGTVILSELPGLGIRMDLVDKEEALSATQATDLLAWSVLKPSEPIPSPRSLSRARYRLSLKPRGEGETRRRGDGGTRQEGDKATKKSWLELNIPESPCQKVQKNEDSVIVEIISPPAGEGCGASVPPPSECSEQNLFEGAGDASVDKMAQEVLGSRQSRRESFPKPRSEALLKLRRHVFTYIEEKNFRSLFASAPEVIQSRSGDCTEHSVLLSALLKVSGFPSRWVMGLMYTEGAFLYHEWVETYQGGQWRPLDAAWPNDRVDATHIALTRSCSFDEFLINAPSITGLIGRLEIEVLELY